MPRARTPSSSNAGGVEVATAPPQMGERAQLHAGGLTVDGAHVASWARVVSVRVEAAGRGGRAAAVYYVESPRACCGCAARPPMRVCRDVDDPSGQPGVSSFRDLHGLRALVIANGNAGRGDGVRLAHGIVARTLRDAGLDVVVRQTESAGHAADLAAEAAVATRADAVDVVIAVGGDGTLHEIFNGLVRGRSRIGGGMAEHAYPLVGVVPAGGGNAVAESLGVQTPLDGVLNIIHSLRTQNSKAVTLLQYGRILRRRLSDPSLETARESLAVCGLQWGLVADADLGTEGLRWMGDARFDVGGLKSIMCKKAYHARVRLRIHRGLQHEVDKRLERSGGGSRGRALERAGDEDVIIEGRFVTIVAWNMKYQSRQTALTPYARPEEPCFDVMLVREGTLGRIQMLQAMSKVSKGTDAYLQDCDGIEYYKCKRIALERLDGQYLSIDGESVPPDPCFLSVAPESGLIRVLGANVNE